MNRLPHTLKILPWDFALGCLLHCLDTAVDEVVTVYTINVSKLWLIIQVHQALVVITATMFSILLWCLIPSIQLRADCTLVPGIIPL